MPGAACVQAAILPNDRQNRQRRYSLFFQEHPHTVQLYEVYDDSRSYYLVMEYLSGGELFEYISRGKAAFTEARAAALLKSLVLFEAYCHGLGIAHLDLKPENILFDCDGPEGVLKASAAYTLHFLQ